MNVEMQWEDPPQKQKRSGKWSAIFEELRANPGRWAKLAQGKDRNSHSLAGRLRAQFNGEDEFEIISQKTEPIDDVDQAGVWARFVSMPEERKNDAQVPG